MKKAIFPIILLLVWCIPTGCRTTKTSSFLAEDVNSYRGLKISSVMLKNGENRVYDQYGGRYIELQKDSGMAKQIVGYDPFGTAVNLNVNSILEVKCESLQDNAGGTALGVLLGIAGGLILGIFILAASFHGWSVG